MIKNQIQENPGNSSLKGNDKQFELVGNSSYPRSSYRGSTGTFNLVKRLHVLFRLQIHLLST